MWIQALSYFREKGEDQRIKECLGHISKGHILSPLLVLEILQNHESDLTFDCVKEYLLKELQSQDKEIKDSRGEIDETMEGIQTLRDESVKLKSERKLFE
jgi:hypothetical protein